MSDCRVNNEKADGSKAEGSTEATIKERLHQLQTNYPLNTGPDLGILGISGLGPAASADSSISITMKRKCDKGDVELGPKVKKQRMVLSGRMAKLLGEDFYKNLWIGHKFYKISNRWVKKTFPFTVRFKWDETGKLNIFACEVCRQFRTKETLPDGCTSRVSDPVSHYYDTVVIEPEDKHRLDYERIVCNIKGVHVYLQNQNRLDIGRQTTENSIFSLETHCD
jgi:hypothetical protein